MSSQSSQQIVEGEVKFQTRQERLIAKSLLFTNKQAMERKLAHIEKIEWIKPIDGADQIEICGVLGWQCVIAKKDNFRVGDIVVYVEVDSVMPERLEFEFLRNRKFRIRTIKLRGQISQGLVLPISIHSDNKFFDYPQIKTFCKSYNLDYAPLVKQCKMKDIGSTVQDFVEFSKGKSQLANIHREGVVIRCVENGKKIFSFKSINPDFLLKYND